MGKLLQCKQQQKYVVRSKNNLDDINKEATTIVLRPFVRDYPGELVPEETFTHPPSWSSSNLYQLLPSTTIYSILTVQTTCLAIFLLSLSPRPLWCRSYAIDFFTQSVSSFQNTCPYQNLFCCSIKIISSTASLSLNSLLGTLSFTLTLHIHLTNLICARWSATSLSSLTGQVSLPCSILLCTLLLLYSLPFLINDVSVLISNGNKGRNRKIIWNLKISDVIQNSKRV